MVGARPRGAVDGGTVNGVAPLEPHDGAPVADLVLVAEQLLVGEAVRVALMARGVRVTALPWVGSDPEPRPRVVPDRDDVSASGLLLTELDSPASVHRARQIVAGHAVCWFVMTSAPRGPLWGAVLDVGARAVLPSSLELDQAIAVLTDPGRLPQDADHELVEAGRALWEQREAMAERLHTLSPREDQVLRMLHRGESVSQVTEHLGTTPATVRSQVKAVLRKLGVSSQIAAVGAYAVCHQRASLPQPSAVSLATGQRRSSRAS